jgi:two-component system nitrogen regulation sensor histidine kinase GlnL
VATEVSLPSTCQQDFHSFDLLSTLIAVIRTQGEVLFANAALEDALGISRRTVVGSHFPDCFTQPALLQNAMAGSNELAALRFDAWLLRLGRENLPVHVTVTLTEVADQLMVELMPLAQQTRQDREERLAEQAQANKELVRNRSARID